MEIKITGRVWKYGDDVNTDVIFPGKYTYSITDRQEMAQHALEDLDPEFVKNVRPGDIVVAGKNWGCGSSREQAVIAFARIYFRNCINEGLPIVTCDAVDGVETGEEITIDFEAGKVTTARGEYSFPPLPASVLEILNAGGLVPHIKKKLALA